MTYFGCKLAIKKFLRNSGFEFCNNNVINLTACLQKLYETNKGCKSYYDVLNQNDAKPNCCSKWEDKLQRNIPWQSCFHQLSKNYDVNIKWFQMRIIHRIIGTNVKLKEMGVTNNNKCSFCLTETLYNTYFGNVNTANSSGHAFWSYWKRSTSCYRLRLSECLILFGIDDNIKTENVFDFILLLAKQYLYKFKIEKQPPNIDIFRKKMVIQIQNRGIQC